VFIFDAHNVDHLLLQQELGAAASRGEKAGRQARRLLAVTQRRESNLAHYVDAFFACSEQDRETLARLNPEVAGFVVPNGVDCSRFAFRPLNERPMQHNVLFCGSLDYPANQDGLEWFGSLVWPGIREKFADAVFTVVGRGGSRDAFGEWAYGAGVCWVGEVEEVIPHYQDAAVAICPLRIGSGTRLKILEALSTGTPIVSTALGAEGLLEKCADVISLADSPAAFGAAVCRLLSDRVHADRLSWAGRNIAAAEYDWDVVGQGLDAAIERLLPSRAGAFSE
jgi:glycosyltransferase involved in cell wall biosynthesis